MTNQEPGCCHNDPDQSHGDSHHNSANARTAASATVHCLTGCVIGEFTGLALGVHFGWAPMTTIIVATALAFTSGFALTLIPLMRGRGLSFSQAWKIIWLGEIVSISVMEIAMNFTDYHMGGMTADGLGDPLFWLSFIAAVVAGFIAAFPVNWWLLSRNLKNCH